MIVKLGDESCRLDITRHGGQLNHYFHFILDFVWPIHNWWQNHDQTAALTDVIPLDPKMLHFADAFYEIFGVRMRKDRLRLATAMSHVSRKAVDLNGFNSVTRDYLKVFDDIDTARDSLCRFRAYLQERFAAPMATCPAVILIERETGSESRGASRRTIANHGELAQTLAAYCVANGLEFLNVKLEHLSFAEGFACFNRPGFVIGQHGAGLLNALWLEQSRSSVIELADARKLEHFSNLCSDFDIAYERLQFPFVELASSREAIDVDPATVLRVLDHQRKLVSP